MNRMDIEVLLNGIDRKSFSREDIQKRAEKLDPGFRKTQMRYLIGRLLQSGKIVRVSHGIYQQSSDHVEKKTYTNQYSESTKKLIRRMQKKYPMLHYRVWELRWLNEFFNHQITQNKVFLEVENEGCDFVYDYLFDAYQGKILLRPSSEEIYRYGIDGTVIIDRLISEAPPGFPDKYNVPLEKIIVDLFANKKLQAMLSRGDYPDALENIFRKYEVNQSAMLRYARRRNKKIDMCVFFEEKTDIEMLTHR